MSDIEIARAAKKRPIQEIGAMLDIPAADLVPYGHDKAKVSAGFIAALAGRGRVDCGDQDQLAAR
ncbi:MAG: formate--tetrahydrofolate ligase, partial [Pseudomonadota bacterium]